MHSLSLTCQLTHKMLVVLPPRRHYRWWLIFIPLGNVCHKIDQVWIDEIIWAGGAIALLLSVHCEKEWEEKGCKVHFSVCFSLVLFCEHLKYLWRRVGLLTMLFAKSSY